MAGIGLTKHGRYARKLGDEMGIQKKRPFENNMHCLSKGFSNLAMPSNAEAAKIHYA